jgi:hypothetical protein
MPNSYGYGPLSDNMPAPEGKRATCTKLVPNIARGLLNGPAIARRVAECTAEHVVRLERIKRLQADGHAFSKVRAHPARRELFAATKRTARVRTKLTRRFIVSG